MRRLCILSVALATLVSSPLLAGSVDASSPVFGRLYCRPQFTCSDLKNSERAREVESKVISIAEQCARKIARTSSSGAIIESSFGLDSSLCMTTKTLPMEKNGMTIVPKCCVKVVEGNPQACQVVCTKYGIK